MFEYSQEILKYLHTKKLNKKGDDKFTFLSSPKIYKRE